MCEDTDKVGMNEVEYFDLYNSIKGMAGERDVAMAIFQEMAKDMRANEIRQGKAATLRRCRHRQAEGLPAKAWGGVQPEHNLRAGIEAD